MDVEARTEVVGQGDGEIAAPGPDAGPQAQPGQWEDVLLLRAVQEIRQLWTRTLCWQEAGRPAAPPLSVAELRSLQARARGEGPQGQTLPPYLVEPYRAACRWYAQAVGPARDGRD